ncbi:MAG: transposase, partial [Erysipelotrichaceae bacterium]|nr:transposase [Erysipelotrichaceae bacterium]
MTRGRPKGVKNRQYSIEFKQRAMNDYFDNYKSKREILSKYSISSGTFDVWKKNYLDGVLEAGRKRTGNRFSALHSSKKLTREERLELENLKLRIENERLKKGYLVKGGGVNKEYVT